MFASYLGTGQKRVYLQSCPHFGMGQKRNLRIKCHRYKILPVNNLSRNDINNCKTKCFHRTVSLPLSLQGRYHLSIGDQLSHNNLIKDSDPLLSLLFLLLSTDVVIYISLFVLL